MTGCFAIIPDGTGQPAALFEDLEDAVDWAVRRYGGDTFRIRYVEVMPLASGASAKQAV
jgi:hypothetical protein